jgi:hypothetical protein
MNMLQDQIVIYTCVTGGFDELKPVPDNFHIRCILFTDNPNHKINGWESILIDTKDQSAIEANRVIKIKFHSEILKYQYSIYIDGNVTIDTNALFFINELIGSGSDMSLNKHPRFGSVYEDLFEIFRVGIVDGNKMISVMKECINLGISSNDSFYECNIIFRKHSSKILNFADDWWEFFKKGTGRDQAAFLMSVKKNNFNILDMRMGDIRSNSGKFFSIENHSTKKFFWLRFLKRILSEIKLTRFRFFLLLRKTN